MRFETVEMHTGGEPVRIVVDGLPPIEGETILDKRRFAMDHLDGIRRVLMHEPRGHFDMYGVLPVAPDDPAADLGVLFTHNEGFSTMCGHATIAIGKWAVDGGRVVASEPVTSMRLQVPAGTLDLAVQVANGRAGSVSFRSVPAFAAALGVPVTVGGYGSISIDVGYGGAFYAVADAAQFDLDVGTSPTRDLVDAAWATTRAVRTAIPLDHPESLDLAFLYGTILTDGVDEPGHEPSANVCVFADRQVDRSPTGSGVTARIAIQRAKGLVDMGVERTFESITGSRFTGTAVAEVASGDRPAWIVEISGEAFYTGGAVFTVDERDPLPSFLLR